MRISIAYLLVVTSLSILLSCGEENEETIDPIIGAWSLNEVAIEAQGAQFDYFDRDDDTDLFGESSYTLQFNADLSYQRTLVGVPFTDGSFGNIDEEGTWSKQGTQLMLAAENVVVQGLTYDFGILSNDGTELSLGFTDTGLLFPQSKINEWFMDGILNSEGVFTVTEQELDSLEMNFQQQVQLDFIVRFTK
ncbi:MAG: hypothetical protein AAF789_03410 [Bacteroidota bacterium]